MPNRDFRRGGAAHGRRGKGVRHAAVEVAQLGHALSAVVLMAFAWPPAPIRQSPRASSVRAAATAPATPGSARDFAVNVGDIVYFTTDSVELSPEASRRSANQARWLQQYSQYTITIEGHADERGTREYNIALGAKRARPCATSWASTASTPSASAPISYGKERPVAVCNDISCWSQNRRAQTVLNSRHDARS